MEFFKTKLADPSYDIVKNGYTYYKVDNGAFYYYNFSTNKFDTSRLASWEMERLTRIPTSEDEILSIITMEELVS